MGRAGRGAHDAWGVAGGGWASSRAARGRDQALGAGDPASRQQRWVWKGFTNQTGHSITPVKRESPMRTLSPSHSSKQGRQWGRRAAAPSAGLGARRPGCLPAWAPGSYLTFLFPHLYNRVNKHAVPHGGDVKLSSFMFVGCYNGHHHKKP